MQISGYLFKSVRSCCLVCMPLLMVGCSSMADSETAVANDIDPWESANRKVYAFNKVVDDALLLPATRAYDVIVPDVVEKSVSNVFNNLSEVKHFANHLLQGKPLQAANDAGRFVINSSVGLVGIFDVAADLGMYAQAEDFGQTLGYWGFESGPYVVLPLMGPSSVRDAASLPIDKRFDLLAEYKPEDHKLGLQVLQVLDTRNQLQDLQQFVIGDEYTFVRDAYLARQAMQIRDGRPVTDNGKVTDEFDEFD
jgi:phospholipid-binding lipoprotein MlaA